MCEINYIKVMGQVFGDKNKPEWLVHTRVLAFKPPVNKRISSSITAISFVFVPKDVRAYSAKVY